jgi:membrane associated rhomboid family serine protease
MVMIYGGIEVVMALQNGSSDNVAHFAHIGGMLFGFILLKYWQRTGQH